MSGPDMCRNPDVCGSGPEHITSVNAPELDIFARLNENRLVHYYEPEEGLFIAESPKVITRALEAGYEPVSLLIEEGEMTRPETAAVLEQCRKKNAAVYTADYETLTGITGYELVRGALCAMRRRPLPEIGTLLTDARRIAVLEDVENPTNVGAIFRSAAALGLDAVICTKGCSDPLYRRSIRVSMGTVFQVPWTMTESVRDVGRCGFRTVAMALRKDTVDIQDERIRKEEKLAIVLGAEGEGLREETIKEADYTVRIPMRCGVDSLNVSAAAAIAFWELSK